MHALASNGGVSKIGLVLGIALTILVSKDGLDQATEELRAQHGNLISDILPAEGSQTWGDGRVVSLVDEAQVEVAKTSAALKVVSASIKLFMGTRLKAEEPIPIQTFLDGLQSKELKDGWGKDLKINDYGNHFLIVSAGSDGVFDSPDDLIQHVVETRSSGIDL